LLDAVPRGRLSEIVGPRSGGGTSLLLALLARVAAAGDPVALVDAYQVFDPAAAASGGLDLSALLWVRGDGRPAVACRAAELLGRARAFAVVALDLGESAPGPSLPAAVWLRLQRAVEGTPTALVLRAPRPLAGSAAALVVAVERAGARWVGSPRSTRLDGLGSRVLVSRSRIPRGHATASAFWPLPS
jgi:hypothetical protein